ncbi:MAG: hypothetical protein M1825_004836 [Sarcosagium campestre]|nr:MAG: hypothetical protein M1825_004836 [Sarcosagium campestre]
MIRLLPSNLPKDPEYPHDLKKLGYFINENDYVKAIDAPEEDFEYFIDKNDRYNKMHGEAFNSALRKIALERLEKLGLPVLRVPLGARPDQPHIPILATPDLHRKQRIVIVFGESCQDLGIWAYRSMGREQQQQGGGGTVDAGSAVDFVRKVQSAAFRPDETEAPGLVFANLGQLLWWRHGRQAVSFNTWDAIPRESAVSSACLIDNVRNRVPGNNNPHRHIEYVFNEVIAKLANPHAKLEILGVADGSLDVTYFLNDFWYMWGHRISAFALTAPLHDASDVTNARFAAFMRTRARAFLCNPAPANTLIATEPLGCMAVSSGESQIVECIMPNACNLIIDYLREMAIKEDVSMSNAF